MLKKRGFIILLLIALIYWGFFFADQVMDSSQKEREGFTTAESRRETALKVIENQMEVFMIIEGRYPDSLEELVEKEYMEALPDPKGRPWEYDQSAGRVK